jgi:hypothetical protein
MHEFIILYVFKVRLKRKFDTSTFIDKARYADSLSFDVTMGGGRGNFGCCLGNEGNETQKLVGN